MTTFTNHTYVAGDVLSQANANLWLRDNLLSCKEPASSIVYLAGGADFTTSSGSYVTISNTYLRTTITTDRTSGTVRVFVGALFNVLPSDNATVVSVAFDLVVDGVGVLGAPLAVVKGNNSQVMPVQILYPYTVNAGTRDMYLRWRVSDTARTARIFANNGGSVFSTGGGFFMLREMS